MPAVYSALDIVSSSSRGEGFSNAIAEAMACERTCVVTDVGDSAWIVGGTGRVVPPRSSDALAAAWHELTALPMSERRMLGKAARQRVEDMFSVTRMVDATGAILGLWAN
jgi:glycosyltransferase involved in cell wall biosynthesis